MLQLTIIIPHFNDTASLSELLDTIPVSADIQTIVIDDQSDLSHQEKLMKLHQTKNFELYHNSSGKKGAGTCRNIGLKNAKGKWLLFADADDYFINGFYETVQRYFESEVDVVYFRPTSIIADTGEVSSRHIPFAKLISDAGSTVNSKKSELSLRYKFIVPWSKLMRRAFVNKYSIDFDDVIAANDVMFATKAGWYLNAYDISEEVIYCATTNKGSLTMTINDTVFDVRLNVFIRQYQFLRKRLSKADFKLLGLSGRPLLIKAVDIGWKKPISVFLKLKYHRVRILEAKLLNPVRFVEKTMVILRKRRRERPYYINK
ncbi:Glycosyltransferase involved in cell wall bisynthesis [Lentibacillus persicus]|uniref:Glycosyltransferase involved in cell wall bisynthesis n=1 Tax=Lentibacillus persicus TaxID=640948 RepID=A0A1I1XZY4_9BACI|nr:glycosyltransferase family 2 protein [Lentibacillus persicus]SFE11373.1 Glycosyltransferase involved in cell wall bisynthesis [Lentibacillus persicus]